MTTTLQSLIATVITDDDKVGVHAQNCVMRIQEVAAYQTNIDNFNNILSKMPDGEWPEDLIKYKGIAPTNYPGNVPDELVESVSQYNYRDYLRGRLITEKAEQAKSQALLEAHFDAVQDKDALTAKVQAIVAARNNAG